VTHAYPQRTGSIREVLEDVDDDRVDDDANTAEGETTRRRGVEAYERTSASTHYTQSHARRTTDGSVILERRRSQNTHPP